MKWRMVMLGAIIGGGLAALGTIGSGLIGKSSAKDQMAHQMDMSSTSYQRAMEDMRLAGLNPILAYQQGGASTGSGAGWSMDNPVSEGVSTALAMKQNKAVVANTNATTAKTQADTNVSKQNSKILELEVEVKQMMLDGLKTAQKKGAGLWEMLGGSSGRDIRQGNFWEGLGKVLPDRPMRDVKPPRRKYPKPKSKPGPRTSTQNPYRKGM